MQHELNFNIIIPMDIGTKLQYIKNKSTYNNNYYILNEYGDWISYGWGYEKNNILKVEYDEFFNCYTYSFGHFTELGDYYPALTYSTTDDVLDGIPIEEVLI